MRALLLAGVLLGAGLTLAACDAVGSESDQARITVRLTDAPFPFDLADSANVSITRIELLAADDDDAEADSTDDDGTDDERSADRVVLFDAAVDGGPMAFNLLDLRDGVDTTLVSASAIPSDRVYTQIRVYVGPDASVVFTDGSRYDLKLPSAQRSGIKIKLPAYELGGDEIDLLLDFNVEESFVTRGNPAKAGFQGFLFKPVLKVKGFKVDDRESDDDSDDGEG